MHLKQPKKYTHQSLTEDRPPLPKTKPISKLADRKQINKKNEPSAIRLAAINDTFHKIEANADLMISQFDIDHESMSTFLQYSHKVKCLCGRNIKYYCLKCMFKNPELTFPSVTLPITPIVIHHSSEKINKSSIIPMCLLSQQISRQCYNPAAKQGEQGHENNLLEGVPSEGTFILYPHKDSQLLTAQLAPQIKKVVILDCTWFQTDQLLTSLSKKGLKRFIRLENYESLYWRYNHHNDKALSSAEALIYFLREYQKSKELPTKEYDPLMFLYCLSLKIIESGYRKSGQGGLEPKAE